MKHALFAFALVSAGPALADANDDYVACLIGQSAVVLHKQKTKDAYEAQEIAYDLCPQPPDESPDGGESEGISDYVNLMVERMAAE